MRIHAVTMVVIYLDSARERMVMIATISTNTTITLIRNAPILVMEHKTNAGSNVLIIGRPTDVVGDHKEEEQEEEEEDDDRRIIIRRRSQNNNSNNNSSSSNNNNNSNSNNNNKTNLNKTNKKKKKQESTLR